MVIPLDRLLPADSSDTPEGRGPRNPLSVLLRVGFAEHIRHRICW